MSNTGKAGLKLVLNQNRHVLPIKLVGRPTQIQRKRMATRAIYYPLNGDNHVVYALVRREAIKETGKELAARIFVAG